MGLEGSFLSAAIAMISERWDQCDHTLPYRLLPPGSSDRFNCKFSRMHCLMFFLGVIMHGSGIFFIALLFCGDLSDWYGKLPVQKTSQEYSAVQKFWTPRYVPREIFKIKRKVFPTAKGLGWRNRIQFYTGYKPSAFGGRLINCGRPL